MKKKKDWVDKRLSDINKWGVLTLLDHLFAEYRYNQNLLDTTLCYNQGRNLEYEGSPLEAHRLLTDKVTEVYHREMSKLEKLKEEGKF